MGASAAIAAATRESTDEQLTSAFAELAEAERSKIKAAVGSAEKCKGIKKSEILQTRGWADTPKGAKTMRKPGATHVIRIALTGGPCAGKSSALEHIITTCKKEGFDVYCAPETATIIFNSGVTTDVLAKDESALAFQISLNRMQLQMERSLIKIAESTGRPSIIVFDRGIMDNKGYATPEMWEKILSSIGGGDGESHQTGVTEDYLLARYDSVVHLVTAADGAEKFYKFGKTTDDSGKVVIRSETPEQARELDRKMQEAWATHPNHVVVRNEDGLQAKMDKVSEAVLSAAKTKH